MLFYITRSHFIAEFKEINKKKLMEEIKLKQGKERNKRVNLMTKKYIFIFRRALGSVLH